MTVDVHAPPAGLTSPMGASSIPPRAVLSQTKPHKQPGTVQLLAFAIQDLVSLNGRVTADDLRNLCPNAPNKTANVGAAFRLLLNQNKIMLIGREPSRIPGNNGRSIGVYGPPPTHRIRVCP